ncbi:DUF4012 domain-containing protein [Microbacterium sp. S1037]|uniref:DUF4012 domain-containing protein n=1 Tax=Microbacterium sp. S1037 TaxID=3398227 RepID=UPI003AAD2339
MSRKPTRRLRPRTIAWISLGALSAVLVALAAAVAIGGFIAQKELRAAVPVVSKMQEQFGSDDRAALASSVSELQGHAASARGAADTPLWWIAEQAPFIGPSLHAVRESTVAVDELAQGILPALVDVDPAILRPTGGAFDVNAMSQLAGPVSEAAASGERAADALSGVDLQDTPGMLRGPLSQLTGAVATLQPALSRANALMPQLASLMGQDGPKNYLLLVQNNAEARGTGGIPASVVELRVENGKMEIVKQATSRSFKNKRETPILPLDGDVVKLYDDKVGRWSQDMTSTPDFELSAHLAEAYWKESFGTSVDGVMSIDPVALSYVLRATGPVKLKTGDELTASNAVQTLLSDVYARYPNNADQDEFFASAAVEIFDAVSSGDFKPVAFAEAVNQAVNENRLYFYPFDDATRGALAGSRLLGPLPANERDGQTTLGVFVNDLTQSKLSFYTSIATEVQVNRCSATPTYTTVMTFANTLDPLTAEGLVPYVDTASRYDKGTVGTDLQFYGPAGGKFVNAALDGVDVSITTGEHLGRPVGRMWIVNPMGTQHTLAVKFEGEPDDGGTVSLVHTPMVNPVTATVVEVPCGN